MTFTEVEEPTKLCLSLTQTYTPLFPTPSYPYQQFHFRHTPSPGPWNMQHASLSFSLNVSYPVVSLQIPDLRRSYHF